MRLGERMMTKIAGEVVFIDPHYRHQGIESLVLAWGAQKADERGVDCYVEESQAGVPLHGRYGLESIRDVEIKPEKEENLNSGEWKRFDGELVEAMTVMRRP